MRRHAGTALVALVLLGAGFLGAIVGADSASTPLTEAVKRGDHDAVRRLLRGGGAVKAAVNAAEPDGMTALHWAVQGGDIEATTLLLRAGADPKAANRYGVRPLTLAATNGDARMVAALLAAGADAKGTGPDGEPVVMTAARTGDPDTIRQLLTRGADVNAREPQFGETALMWAAAENHGEAVRLLLEAGAQANQRSRQIAAPVLEFPRSGGPNSPFPRGGWTPLMFAARDGSMDAARALLDGGADPNLVALPETDVPLKDDELTSADRGVGTSALVFAIINSHYDLAAMLLEKGANPNVEDLSGMAALYAAVDMNSLQWVQGRPAPILHDRLDAVDLVKVLLAKGANPNQRLKRGPLKRHHDAGSTLGFGTGATPLMRAARTNDVAVMKVLLDGGADPFLTLPDRTSALLIAAGLGYGGLRGEGIRIVVPTADGAVEALGLLLDRGMDVDAFNAAGNTALHGAVSRGDAVVKYLASRGASLDVKNKAGFTPLDLANGAGGRGGRPGAVRESTVALLKQLMAASAASTAAPNAVPGRR